MKKFIRIAIVGALVALGFALHSPAQAAEAAHIDFVGTASIGGGLGYPVDPAAPGVPSLPGPTNTFSFASDTCVDATSDATVAGVNGPSCSISATGTVTGYCGLSEGQGSGTYNSSNGKSYNFSFTWKSVGGELIITGSVAGGGTLASVVTAVPPLPVIETGSCSTGTATSFRIVGDATALIP